jgi:hypothetical protein
MKLRVLYHTGNFLISWDLLASEEGLSYKEGGSELLQLTEWLLIQQDTSSAIKIVFTGCVGVLHRAPI